MFDKDFALTAVINRQHSRYKHHRNAGHNTRKEQQHKLVGCVLLQTSLDSVTALIRFAAAKVNKADTASIIVETVMGIILLARNNGLTRKGIDSNDSPSYIPFRRLWNWRLSSLAFAAS